MSDYRELLLGCGHSRQKKICPPLRDTNFLNLTTLDVNATCDPDVLFDLNRLGLSDLPFASDYFNEIHAYEVLEHLGEQGDVDRLFSEFHEYWRVLKPGGYFCATVPWWQSIWAWGDPGHTRVLSPATLVFLDQAQYAAQLGKTPMSDYREMLGETNFRAISGNHQGDLFVFVLQAIKP